MKQSLVVAMVCAWALAASGSAARAGAAVTDTTAPRTLEEYRRLARAANADIKVAAARARVVSERIGVARGYPDPSLLYGYYVTPDGMKGRQEIVLQQEVPFPGKRGLRGEATSREANMAARMADAMALDVDLEVKMAFYRYVEHAELVGILQTEGEVLRRMREVANVRYASGTAEQQEVLKVELALSRLADESTVHHREIAAIRARLNELIGRDADSPLPDPVWSKPDVSAIDRLADPDSARARRPEIAAAREEIAMAEAVRRLAKREYVPDFMLGVTYEFGAGEESWWEVMAGMSLPTFIGKRRAMVREAEAMRETAEHRLDVETFRAAREVEEAAARARAARERLERFETMILPQAEQAFISSEAGYRAGRVDFLDYLDSERMLLEMRKEYAMVVADLGMQMAALERAVGAGASGE